MSSSDTPRASKSAAAGDKHSLALDGLRWWAFFAVFLYHFREGTCWFGKFGVTVFFVLSGFLIGRILIRERKAEGIPIGAKLKFFYIRRVLRIFPLYYFALLMILIMGKSGVLKQPHFEAMPFHFLSLTNFYLFFLPRTNLDSQTHFWSLAVEQHFYLFAPFLILLVPIRRLEIGIAVLFVTNILLRLLNFFVWHRFRFEYLSPLEFDILCLGVAAAIIEQQGSFLGITGERLIKIGKVCAIPTVLLIAVNSAVFTWNLRIFSDDVLFPSLVGVCSAALVYAFWTGRTPRGVAAFFVWPPLVYLGRISYGLYVYHNFFFVITRTAHFSGHRDLAGAIALTAVIVTATLSWYILEQPINNLKRFFPYPKPTVPTVKA